MGEQKPKCRLAVKRGYFQGGPRHSPEASSGSQSEALDTNCLAPCVLGISDRLTRYVGFFEGPLCAPLLRAPRPAGAWGLVFPWPLGLESARPSEPGSVSSSR